MVLCGSAYHRRMGSGYRRAAQFVTAALIAGCGEVRYSKLFDSGDQPPDSGACVAGERLRHLLPAAMADRGAGVFS